MNYSDIMETDVSGGNSLRVRYVIGENLAPRHVTVCYRVSAHQPLPPEAPMSSNHRLADESQC